MLTTGTYLRGYPYNDLTAIAFDGGFMTLSSSFEKLFSSIANIFNLGLGIENTYSTDNVLVNPKVVIEEKTYFYQQLIILQIDTLSDLEYMPDKTLLYQGIEVGYNKIQNDNIYGQAEYNNKATYATPLIPFTNKLSILSDIRADGTGIEQLRTTPIGSELRNDKEIFIISCIKKSNLNSGQLTSLQEEDTTILYVQGVYPIIFNSDITPARMLLNCGDFISIGLQNNIHNKITFQKSEKPTKVLTQKGIEAISENSNVDISRLKTPYLKGEIVRFNAPVGTTEIKAIESNKHGLIKFYDYIDKRYRYGWIKEVSTNPVDKTTNWELMLAVGEYFSNFGYWLAEDGSYILAEDNSLILNEIQ
jgi:hypothetical protein